MSIWVHVYWLIENKGNLVDWCFSIYRGRLTLCLASRETHLQQQTKEILRKLTPVIQSHSPIKLLDSQKNKCDKFKGT